MTNNNLNNNNNPLLDQGNFLDEAISTVLAQGFHIRKAIENSQLRVCLKEVSVMLAELKTSLLVPKNYYQLYTVIFDQMQSVEQYFREELKRGRSISDLYESVQQAANIIPRIYLLITVGSIYIESGEVQAKQIIFDILQMIKGVQNPLRGLFLRYFCLKMLKDKLPDTNNQYLGEGGSIDDSVDFIIQNLEEMNKLWVKLSNNCTGAEKIIKDKERNDLKVLVGENIIRLSSLTGLTLEKYQKNVLPRIIALLLNSKDQLIQQYLMECIIFAFPNDYNVYCLGLILDTCTKLLPTVDIKSLFISLMDKLAKIVGEVNENEEENEILREFTSKDSNIFDLLKKNIDKIIKEQGDTYDNYKLLELLVAFMKFTIKCNKQNIECINHILSSSVNIVSRFSKTNGKISQEGIKLVMWLLTYPLDSLSFAIFDMNQYPLLMNYLDFSNRKTLALRIIESIMQSKKKLNSIEKIDILLEFINSLLIESSDYIENDLYEFEYEMQSVSKVVYLVHNENCLTFQQMLSKFKAVYSQGGVKRIKYLIPPLVSSYLHLISKMGLNLFINKFECQYDELYKNHYAFFIGGNIDVLSNSHVNDSEYLDFFKKVYEEAFDCIKLMNLYPEIAFRLCITALENINKSMIFKLQYEDQAKYFLDYSFKLLNEDINENDSKLSSLLVLVGCLDHLLTTFDPNTQTLSNYYNMCIASTAKISKRNDQCVAMIACSNLYWNHQFRDGSKVKDLISKAKKYAEYSMTNYTNLNLFIFILNKYIYFIDKKCDAIENSMVIDVIEIIKSHIETIKNENTNPVALPDIQRYFESTMEIIRKKENLRNICSELSNLD